MNISKYPNRIRNDQYMLRLPNSLRERIKSHAKTNSRSMNTEMVRALETAFPEPVEPESINEKLLLASKALLADWSQILSSLGQDPTTNSGLSNLTIRINEAEQHMNLVSTS